MSLSYSGHSHHHPYSYQYCLVSMETASIQRNILRQGLCTQEEVLANRKFYFLTKQERGRKAAAEIHRNIQLLRNIDELTHQHSSRNKQQGATTNVAQFHQSDAIFVV